MRLLLKRTKRRKSEHGFIFNEEPEVICICDKFPPTVKDDCGNLSCTAYKKHVITIPFGKHYSKCEKSTNPCLTGGELEYKEGRYVKPRCCK